jgi:hypothetical protein
MKAHRFASRLSLLACALLASASLLTVAGCRMPPALSKAELEAAKLPEKHPTVSAEKTKAGCGSCHREAPAIKNASD